MQAPWHGRKVLLIDLDDTLYRVPEIPTLMRDNIQRYMLDQLHIAAEQVPDLCTECYSTYGTTMAGLVAKGYSLPYDEWHAAVHGTLPYQRLLAKDEQLVQLLQSIPLPKFVFTNADRKHAEVCLGILGLGHLFEGIICFESIQEQALQQGLRTAAGPIICKPAKEAFQLALQQCGGDADTAIFLDDSLRNVSAGRALGMFTVQVGCTSTQSADLAVPTLHALPAWLWSGGHAPAAQHLAPNMDGLLQEKVLVTS
ncbi:hypothetical protein WJX73_005124 [Symbiochloris irregularis]|uniref:Pyrimidine 5-nucleotidase n=1 Tax=Symbiochloris irregularis TaxID=706552 RepID=A0AAW1NXR2_9CHLO